MMAWFTGAALGLVLLLRLAPQRVGARLHVVHRTHQVIREAFRARRQHVEFADFIQERILGEHRQAGESADGLAVVHASDLARLRLHDGLSERYLAIASDDHALATLRQRVARHLAVLAPSGRVVAVVSSADLDPSEASR